MAALTRRTWAEILTEVTRGARGKNYPGYSSRLQYLIYEAWLDIVYNYNHQEMETSTTLAVSTGAYTVAFPSDCHLLMALSEQDDNGLPKKYITPIDIKVLSGIFLGSNSGQPEQYAAFNRVVYFDRKTDADRVYQAFYLKRPTAPDFAGSDPPVTGPQWDAHIIELALMRAAIRDGDMEAAKIYADLYRDYTGQQMKPLLRDSTAPNIGERSTSGRPSGAMQT